ncbi:MAG: hypothetical protein EKK55_19240 [Rhodocyclaceae bacterium]|nr:MAG: hypothetical protein EKK55_19240 [Rhodocyclaceae bacterium]
MKTEPTFNLDHLIGEGSEPCLYDERDPTHVAIAQLTIDTEDGSVGTKFHYLGDAISVAEYKGIVLRINLPRAVNSAALHALVTSKADLIRDIINEADDDERECLVDSLERELEALPTVEVWRAEDWLGDTELVREGETIVQAAERLLGEADEEGVYIIDSIEAVIEARVGQ